MEAALQRVDRAGGAAAARPARAALGNTAKSSTTSGAARTKPTAAEKRAQRYEGLAVARSWLSVRAHSLAPGREAGDLYRTCDCRYVRKDRRVGVQYSAQHQGAHYSGLVTCGSVWACPVCTSVIQNRRRVELTTLIDWAYKQGLAPAMVTLTFPHCRFDRLDDLLERQAAAFKRFRSGNVWTLFKRRSGFRGLVRSLELTHGRNGWHPHTHELWLIRYMDEDERRGFLVFLRERWLRCCEEVGLVDATDAAQRAAFMLHSVDVRFEVNDSDYIAKQDSSRAWGVDREIVAGAGKKGRVAGGVHPHEFLIRRDRGDRQRFLEYVDAMKGKRQLYWSPGLKKACGVDDLDDETVADESREPAELLGELSADDWLIIRAKGRRAQVLEVAETGCWDLVIRYIISIGCDPYGMRDPSTDPPPDPD